MSFVAKYVDASFDTYTIALEGPKQIADAAGIIRDAYALHITQGRSLNTTFYLDGDFNVVRIDDHCINGDECLYASARFSPSPLPAPLNLQRQQLGEYTITDDGVEVPYSIAAGTLLDQPATLIETKTQNDVTWRGWGLRSKLIEDWPAPPTAMELPVPGYPFGIVLERTHVEMGGPLEEIRAWPMREQALIGPGWDSGLQVPWFNTSFTMRAALDALSQSSSKGAEVLSEGCLLSFDALLERPDYDGDPPPDFVEVLGIDASGQAWEFLLQKGGDVVLDVVDGRQWRVTYEDAVDEKRTCVHRPRPTVDGSAWMMLQARWLHEINYAASAELLPAWSALASFVPHPDWRSAILQTSFVPGHVTIDQGSVGSPGITRFVPYFTTLDAEHGVLLRLYLHPDDIARFDAGAHSA